MKISQMNVELVDNMGSDLSVVNAARVSFNKVHNEFDENKDTSLIQYLARHNHWTPFAHTAASLRIKAPIFVARQLVKHQVGLVWNEVSRRYIDEEPEFWFPEYWRGRAENTKQGSSETVTEVKDYFPLDAVKLAFATYHSLLLDGVAPELARIVLPLNTMTEWIWTGNVASFSRVYKLRSDPYAQLEVQEIAEKLQAVLQPLYPVSWKALTEKEQAA